MWTLYRRRKSRIWKSRHRGSDEATRALSTGLGEFAYQRDHCGDGEARQRYVLVYNPKEAGCQRKEREKLLESLKEELEGLRQIPNEAHLSAPRNHGQTRANLCDSRGGASSEDPGHSSSLLDTLPEVCPIVSEPLYIKGWEAICVELGGMMPPQRRGCLLPWSNGRSNGL